MPISSWGQLIRLGDDGSVVLNQEYFDYAGGLRMTNARFHALFGGPPRPPEFAAGHPAREMDLAASIQAVINEALLRLARHVRARTGEDHLVLAGGVALNVVAAGKLVGHGHFQGNLGCSRAAGDAGRRGSAPRCGCGFRNSATSSVPEKPDAMQAARSFWHRHPAGLGR